MAALRRRKWVDGTCQEQYHLFFFSFPFFSMFFGFFYTSSSTSYPSLRRSPASTSAGWVSRPRRGKGLGLLLLEPSLNSNIYLFIYLCTCEDGACQCMQVPTIESAADAALHAPRARQWTWNSGRGQGGSPLGSPGQVILACRDSAGCGLREATGLRWAAQVMPLS